MKTNQSRVSLDGRLAAYMAAAGTTAFVATSAEGVVVTNSTVQPFGVDGAVSIDFNTDGQIDFEVDHDNIDLGGGNVVDFLQIDKNDTNGGSPGENPCPINSFDTFPPGATVVNNTADAAYVIPGTTGDYPAALPAGTLIGPGSTFDFQEGDNFAGSGRTIRANRLIDEDAGQVDQAICGLTAAQIAVPTNAPGFVGLGGEVRYLGLKMGLNSGPVNYGWVGIRIDNEADATGAVVGYAYETEPNTPILAGNVPEPGALAMGGLALLAAAVAGRFRKT